MAKNKVFIDVVVDDKGTTKRLAVDADKLGASLEQTGKSARTADRNLKGAARTSANSTKNFSKMAQGITGGLVPAYATLAAQVFALTAAFDFLRRAADVQNLEAAQVAYAKNTGIALGRMTEQLRAASDGMLSFQSAAQATAIGVAKGFSPQQLNDLAEGARKASTALGRDFEDAFDRLVRGVSKAEPELLDELGITLRLENATNNYAAALNKQVKALTDTERSQAVLVEVQEQLNRNFGQVEAFSNPFIKLQKVLGDLAKDVTGALLPGFKFIAVVLTESAEAAALFFGLLILSLVKTIPGVTTVTAAIGNLFRALNPLKGAIGGIKNLAGSFVDFGREAKAAVMGPIQEFKDFRDSIEATKVSLEQLQRAGAAKAKGVAGQLVADGTASKTVQKVAAGTANNRDITVLKKALKRAEKEYKKSGEIVTGIFAGEDIKRLRHLQDALDDMTRENLRFSTRVKNIMSQTGKGMKVALVVPLLGVKSAFKGITASAKLAGKAINAAMKATVILGIISSVLQGMARIADAPATLAKAVMDTFASIARGVQFFGNLIIDGINQLIDTLPDWVFDMLGLDGADVKIGRLTFADDAKQDIDDFFKGLMGEDYMAKLLAEEETNANLKSIQERAEELTNSYRDLKFAINEVADAATSDKLTDDQRERAAINAVSSLALGSELQKQAALAAQGPEGAAAVEAVIASFREKIEKSNLREVNQELFDAVMEGDTDTVLRLERFSRTYQGVITELRDKISQIPQALSQGDTFALTQLLEEVQRARDVADESAAGLGRRSESADIIGDTLSGFGGIDAAVQAFETTRKRGVELSNEALAIERERVKLANVPSMTRSFLEREINLKREKNKLSVLENELQDINNKLRDPGGADTRILEAQKAEIEQRILNQEAQVKNAEVLFDDLGNAGVQVAQTIESSMASAFQGIIEGTMSAKEAFASMAKSVLSMIARIVSELIVARIIASALGGAFSFSGTGGSVLTGAPPPLAKSIGPVGGPRYGAVMEGYRNGGIAKNYSMGGVAAGRDGGYPAILHGTEAVVPLPNNRSIPVDLQGNAGQQNNVTVNVSIDRDGQASQDTQADSNEGANMGKMLAMAVQEELLNQKRQGGILNPFGVS